MYSLKRIIAIFKQANHSEEETVKRLYNLAERSLVALIMFVFVVAYYLYDSLGTQIVVWGASVVTIALVRLGLTAYYKKHSKSFATRVWHRLFFFSNFVTATLLSIVGCYFIFKVAPTDTFFIIAALVGLIGGAMGSLFPDIRIMITYISIILVPLAVSLFMLGGKVYFLLGLMLILYYLTQLVIAYNTHKQRLELAKHQQKAIEAQEQLFKNRETLEYFYTQAPISIFSYDLDLRITECNDAFLDLFYLKREDIVGVNLTHLLDHDHLHIIKNALKDGVQHYVGPYLSTKGLEYWVEAKSFPIHDHDNRVMGGVVLLEDKTKEHQAVEKLKHLALHDTLTKLSNRRGFRDFMETLVSNQKHQSHYSLLLYLDLNRFKYINDSLGHSFGDRVLNEVAVRLRTIVGQESNLTRFGGDEFVIVTPFVSDRVDHAEKFAKEFAVKVHEAFDEAFVLEGVHLHVKTSIGIVLIEPNFDNIEEIVRHADISMYQAKKYEQDKISFYNDKLDEERKETFALQQDLIHALENDLFELYLQPIVQIDNGSVKAAEALIRWNHPDNGLMQPLAFIPIAIELGVITEIGWWVLKRVCETISAWKEQGLWRLEYISINLNAKQFIKNDFIERFFETLESYSVDTKDIKIEITETSLIDNFELTQQVICELQDRGIKCVIDDFGTGYSSLSYLKKLSFSVLKIDKEFIFDLEYNEENKTLIRTIVEIAKQFRYSIVVEGIETSEQREIIRSIDRNLSYQGFLASEPIPIGDFKDKFIEEGAGSKK